MPLHQIMRRLKLHCKPAEGLGQRRFPLLHISVRSPFLFAMKQVKAVRVNEPEPGGKRRRH